MDVTTGSSLERKFKLIWGSIDGPALEEEVRFHPHRRWRADFVHTDTMTMIEVEGGVFVNGRHNRPSGFLKDAEKYLEAVLLGYRVIRLVSDQLTPETLTRLKDFIEERGSDVDVLSLLK